MIGLQVHSHEGITCFGSALVRVNPDFASLTTEVGFVDKEPKVAFSKTKKLARKPAIPDMG